jgi:hypothetical protein
MTRKLTIPKIAAAVFVLLVGPYLSGCNPAKSDLAVFNAQFEAANYSGAGLFAQNKIKKDKTPSGDDLLWTLQLAAVERTQLNYEQSTACFDKAEEMFNHYAKQSEVVDAVGATIVNDNVVPYKGQQYDGIMVNTYKALNFLAAKNLDLARVEFNRALDRQMRAREHFNEEIRKLEAQLEKEKEKTQTDARAAADDPKVRAIINANYPDLEQFKPYPDFVNPFTTYLAGVYFLLIGENSRAADLLKESAGMVPDNDYIKKDLLFADDVIAGKTKLEKQCWVIFENGLGPVKEEIRVDLPLVLVSRRVYYAGIALPRLRPGNIAYSYLTVKTDAGAYQTSQVTDMEKVVKTEFNKEFNGILIRAIASAAMKAAAQYAATNQDSYGIGGALVALYSVATTAADVRIWSALPKDFQVARCPMPKDGKLGITPAGGAPFEVNIPSCGNAIVYVRIVRAGTSPVYEVLAF